MVLYLIADETDRCTILFLLIAFYYFLIKAENSTFDYGLASKSCSLVGIMGPKGTQMTDCFSNCASIIHPVLLAFHPSILISFPTLISRTILHFL